MWSLLTAPFGRCMSHLIGHISGCLARLWPRPELALCGVRVCWLADWLLVSPWVYTFVLTRIAMLDRACAGVYVLVHSVRLWICLHHARLLPHRGAFTVTEAAIVRRSCG